MFVLSLTSIKASASVALDPLSTSSNSNFSRLPTSDLYTNIMPLRLALFAR